MSSEPRDRREFLKTSLTTAAVAWTGARISAAADAPPPQTARTPRIKFAAIGLNHGHINGQTMR